MQTVIEIKSPALSDVLLEINRGVQGLELNRNPPIVSDILSSQNYIIFTTDRPTLVCFFTPTLALRQH